MLPSTTSLLDWINEYNINSQFCLKQYPYEHAVITNFFKPEVFKSLQEFFTKIDNNQYSKHPNNVYRFISFSSPKFFNFIYSKDFQNYLFSKIGCRLVQCSKYPLPQLYLFDGKEGVPLKVHTDYNTDSPRDFGMIIYLHDYWDAACGGVLNLYDEKNIKIPVVQISPFPNSVVIFRVSPISYHSLTESSPAWVRKTLVIDWDIDNNSNNI